MAYRSLSLETYASLTAMEMMRGVRDGAYSPVALTEAALALVEKLQPQLNCYSSLDADHAQGVARERETEQKAGRFRGALHGLPLSIKDTYHVPGFRTGMGSKLYEDHRATEWSPLAERVLYAGAIMVGKTAMPEFGWTAAAWSPLTGHTRNPWDPALTPGGSSSGSAAAVAARIVPAALSGDGGGSIRIPAAFCGLFGLKASFGRIGVWPGAVHDQLVHHGFLTRNALDMALMLDVGKGPDGRDPWSLPSDPIEYTKTTAAPATSLKVAFVAEPWGIAPEQTVAEVVGRFVDAIREKPGWQIRDQTMPMEYPRETFEVLWSASRMFTSASYLQEKKQWMDPGLVEVIRGAVGLTLDDYLRASMARRNFFSRMQAMFDDVDLVIMPTVPIQPFPVETPPPAQPGGILSWVDWAPYTFPFNLSGHPVASMRCGFTGAGLPIGLQVVAPRFRDDIVLRACHTLEAFLEDDYRMPDLTNAAIRE